MKIMTLDFETRDPYITRKTGAGWAIAYNAFERTKGKHDLKVLGAAVETHEGIIDYVTDWDQLATILLAHDAFIAHKATYELGNLFFLYKNRQEVLDHLDKMIIYDTLLLFKLYRSNLPSYSLDYLAKKYIGESKGYSILTDAVMKNDLFPWTKHELEQKKRAERDGLKFIRTKPRERLLKFAYENLDKLQEVDFESVKKYAISDISQTKDLYDLVKDKISEELKLTYSDLTKAVVMSRLKGIRVDLSEATRVYESITPKLEELQQAVNKIAGEEISCRSNLQIAQVLDRFNISYPRTSLGNPQIEGTWLKNKKNIPLLKYIHIYRTLAKFQKDYIGKIIDLQKYTSVKSSQYGYIYPEVNILEARTGRFSMTNPPLQQMPSKGKFGQVCRSIFIPHDGEKWYSLDYSNQEGCLQVHFATALKCKGAKTLAKQFQQPEFDMHQTVADMVGIDRKTAKIVNLGISYGMGIAKLAESLQLSIPEAKEIMTKYNKLAPYLIELNKLSKKAIEDKGYIISLGGRHLHPDEPIYKNGKKITFEYKALNKLIQGSAADQTTKAMVEAYREGIVILASIHDELVASLKDEDEALRLKEIMENVYTLHTGSRVEYNQGGSDNWGDAK